MLSVSELLFLSLTVEALQGKTCQDSLLSGGGRSVRANISGGRGPPWGIIFGFYKTRHILLSDSANCTVLCAVVFTQYQHDRRTDRRNCASTAIAKRHAVKNVLSSNISSTCPQNMADSSPLTAEIGSGVWAPQQLSFNGFRVLAAATSLTRDQPNFARCLAVSWAATLYTFSGRPRTEFCQVRNSRFVEVLLCPTLAALLHRTPAAAWRREWNYGTSQRASLIVGLAAITLGIGPHSSFLFFKNIVMLCVVLCLMLMW